MVKTISKKIQTIEASIHGDGDFTKLHEETFNDKTFVLYSNNYQKESNFTNESTINNITQVYSLQDIKDTPAHELESYVFTLESNFVNGEITDIQKTHFYQFRQITSQVSLEVTSVLQIIDISTSVRFQKLVGEKNTLEQVNATVSHEMRNPLNSIIAENL